MCLDPSDALILDAVVPDLFLATTIFVVVLFGWQYESVLVVCSKNSALSSITICKLRAIKRTTRTSIYYMQLHIKLVENLCWAGTLHLIVTTGKC